MSNSKLVTYTKISPNSNPRKDPDYNPTGAILKITPHHAAGNASLEGMGDLFAKPARQASANYGIDSKGRIALYVEEDRRAWTSGSRENDYLAVTIEVANDGGAPDWHVSDKALAALIDLCVDICKRNGIARLNYTGDVKGNLTMHKWFQTTQCPGPYLASKFPYIAEQVNSRLEGKKETTEVTLYQVQVGAFSKKANAEALLAKVKAAGFKDAYITTKQGKTAETTAKPAAKPAEVKKVEEGDTVRVKNGAKTYTGGSLAPYIYKRDHKVSELKGDRAVITYDGVVVAAVKVADLTLV